MAATGATERDRKSLHRKLHGFTYVDNKQIAQMAYPFLPYVMQVIEGEMRRSGVDVDTNDYDNIARLTFDYISRLPEFYYFKAVN